MFSKLYNQYDSKTEWLEIAGLGINFLREHAVGMTNAYFSLNEKGKPVWIQRKIFSECFYIIALAEYSRAADRPDLMKEAKNSLKSSGTGRRICQSSAGLFWKGRFHHAILAVPMILLNVIEELTGGNPAGYEQEIEECIKQILLHVHEDKKTVFETVGKDGRFIDSIEGRLLNPGHAIEAGWFLHQWAAHLNDSHLAGKSGEYHPMVARKGVGPGVRRPFLFPGLQRVQPRTA
jgi:N-acylglucosamine 2-epimerase